MSGFILFAYICLFTWNVQAQSADPGLEYQVKAEFIERFTQFIEWPPKAFDGEGREFNVCIEGQGPLRPELERVFSKSRVKGRPVRLREIKPGDTVSGCQMLYIAPSERSRVEEIIRQVGQAPVLTIGDSSGYAELGVFINLYVEGTKVRFAINAAAAKERGLIMSSKLLMLARNPGSP